MNSPLSDSGLFVQTKPIFCLYKTDKPGWSLATAANWHHSKRDISKHFLNDTYICILAIL